ncbi:MAG: ATP-binding protein [Methanobrevibacter sp.]|jgi:hypothetical protein|nr:ATP-binding protein [Methanobrevibacter sp.]
MKSSQVKKLPIGIDDFTTLRSNNYIYVDKTKYIYELFDPGKKYFLSRPRRFGKTLLISTLEELFKGNKDLFKGLFIYNKWDWNKEHPVIKLDFGNRSYGSICDLNESLNNFLNRIAEKYEFALSKTSLISDKFGELLEKIHEKTGERVVVLIDEYDKPIIANIPNLDLVIDIAKVLKSFYGVLKATYHHIEFVFVTGVSKFTNVSLFSDLNNLDDLTLDDRYNNICGYTHEELIDEFEYYINELKDKLGLSNEEIMNKINFWYDGYSWNGKDRLYTPRSTLDLFNKGKFSNYWFKSATPTFLIDVLKKSDDYSEVLNPIIVKDSRLDAFEYNNLDSVAIFFQTGYLTITDEINDNNIIYYKLEFPNYEVEISLFDFLLDLNIELNMVNNDRLDFVSYIKDLDNDNFEKLLNRKFLTHIPTNIHIDMEYYYQSVILSWAKGLGFVTHGEDPTNKGFIDIAIEEDEDVFIIECKFSKVNKKTKKPLKSFEKMLNDGISQIKAKKYHEKYHGKNIFMIAMAFADKHVKTRIEKLN